MSMSIYSPRGTEVIFAHPTAGYEHDMRRAANHLTPGAKYTVERAIVEDWTTRVFLQEVPGVAFNSVHFDDVQVSTQLKALTLWQPWATLIAIGAKRIETRGWATSYRGPLVISCRQKQARLARDHQPA